MGESMEKQKNNSRKSYCYFSTHQRCLFGKAVIVQLHLVMAMKAVGGQLLLQVCDGGNHAVHLLRGGIGEVTEKSLRSPEYFVMCLTYSYVFNVFAHAYDQPRAGQENQQRKTYRCLMVFVFACFEGESVFRIVSWSLL